MMSSFKEIGEATANAHERMEQIRAAHADLQNEIISDIQKLFKKVQDCGLKLHSDLDAVMNGAQQDKDPESESEYAQKYAQQDKNPEKDAA